MYIYIYTYRHTHMHNYIYDYRCPYVRIYMYIYIYTYYICTYTYKQIYPYEDFEMGVVRFSWLKLLEESLRAMADTFSPAFPESMGTLRYTNTAMMLNRRIIFKSTIFHSYVCLLKCSQGLYSSKSAMLGVPGGNLEVYLDKMKLKLRQHQIYKFRFGRVIDSYFP